MKSDFYGARRPRFNEVSFDKVKHIAITVPAMSSVEYRRICAAMANDPLQLTYDTWQSRVREAVDLDNPFKPWLEVASGQRTDRPGFRCSSQVPLLRVETVPRPGAQPPERYSKDLPRGEAYEERGHHKLEMQ